MAGRQFECPIAELEKVRGCAGLAERRKESERLHWCAQMKMDVGGAAIGRGWQVYEKARWHQGSGEFQGGWPSWVQPPLKVGSRRHTQHARPTAIATADRVEKHRSRMASLAPRQ